MPSYSLILKDPSDGTQWELLPKSYTFVESLNQEPTAEIALSFEELERLAEVYGSTVVSIFSVALREIHIKRNGTTIFLGVLSDLEVKPDRDGVQTFYIKAVGYFGLLTKRIAGIPKRVFSSTDAGTIAWTLINESQSADNPYSDWGITGGSITSSVNRDRTYRFDNIRDSIIRLSNANLDDGFDFEIDTSMDFNVYYPTKGSALPNIVFDEETLSNYRWKKPLVLQLTNKAHVVGAGLNDDVLYSTRTAATAYRSPFGTLESVLNERDIETSATLQSKGDRKLDEEQEPVIKFEGYHYDGLNFGFNEYNIGDTVKVNLPGLGLSSASKRVTIREFKMEKDKSVGLIKILLE